MGTSSDVVNNTTPLELDCGTWTAAQLNNAKLRLYGYRASRNVNVNYYFNFYGATITVQYELPE